MKKALTAYVSGKSLHNFSFVWALMFWHAVNGAEGSFRQTGISLALLKDCTYGFEGSQHNAYLPCLSTRCTLAWAMKKQMRWSQLKQTASYRLSPNVGLSHRMVSVSTTQLRGNSFRDWHAMRWLIPWVFHQFSILPELSCFERQKLGLIAQSAVSLTINSVVVSLSPSPAT